MIGTSSSNIAFSAETTSDADARSANEVNPGTSQNMIETSTSTPCSGKRPERMKPATSLSR